MLVKWKLMLDNARKLKYEIESKRVHSSQVDDSCRNPSSARCGRGGKILRGKRQYKQPTNGVGKTGKQLSKGEQQ